MRVYALLTGAAVVLAACGGSTAAQSSGIPGHIHNLAFDGDTLLLGSHEGLWEHAPGSAPAQRSMEAFDVMGLARLGESWVASGHPAEDSGAHGNLGLQRSTDGGRTFTFVSADGVDFHRLAASGVRVLGVASGSGALMRSDDEGRTWLTLGPSTLYDIAIDPGNADLVVGTTPDGLVRSTDGGVTFTPVATSSMLALLAWTEGALIGVDTAGAVLTSDDAGTSWKPVGQLPGQPSALTADGSRVAALVEGTVLQSVDRGKTFTERLTGLVAH